MNTTPCLRLPLAALALTAFLSSCALISPKDVEAERAGPMPTDPFAASLREGYLELAYDEAAGKDFWDANYFLDKARRAGANEAVGPQWISQRYFAPPIEQELARVRRTLLELLGSPIVRKRAPAESARAQVMFDCWLEEQEEGFQPQDIAACRQGFEAALAAARDKAALGQDLFVVIPGEDGHVGSVYVRSGQRRVVLDGSFAAAQIRGKQGLETLEVEPSEVEEVFGSALAARPIPPASYSLYFPQDSLELVSASEPVLQALLVDIARRPVAEITVIGHTDRVGALDYNDRLSLQRAERVVTFLVERGVATEGIQTAGRGEREPLVPTEDGVAEPRNRRVEVSVR